MITDFGLSKMEQNGIMSTACGTPGYVGELRAGCYGGLLWWAARKRAVPLQHEREKYTATLTTTHQSHRHCGTPQRPHC